MTKVTPASSTCATTSRASLRVGAITFSAKTCLPAVAAAGMTSGWATVGVVTTTPSHVPAGEEAVEIVVERDAALGGLRPAPLCVLVPDGAELRTGMLFGLRGVVLRVYVPEAQDRDAEHQLIS